VNRLAFGLVVVALQALCGIDVLVQRDRMNRGAGTRRKESEQSDQTL